MNHFYSLKHEILFLTLPDLYLIVKQLNGNPCTMQSLPSRLNCMVSRDSSPRALWNDFAWAPLDSLLGIHSEWNTVRWLCTPVFMFCQKTMSRTFQRQASIHPCHTAVILSRETKRALFYHAKPRNGNHGDEA